MLYHHELINATDLEDLKDLSGRSEDSVLRDLDGIEAHGLRQGSAFSEGHNIAFFDIKSRRNVHGDVGVALFKSTVLRDIVKVVTANNGGPGHLVRNHNSLENLSSNGDVAGPGALLVDVFSLLGRLRGWEAKTDVDSLPQRSGVIGLLMRVVLHLTVRTYRSRNVEPH